MNPRLLALVTATMPLAAAAQIDYSGGTYSQNFDTLRSDAIYTYYTNMPAGWSVDSILNSYVWTPVTNGYSGNYGGNVPPVVGIEVVLKFHLGGF